MEPQSSGGRFHHVAHGRRAGRVAATQGQAPYFAIFEAEFADAATMNAARASPYGQQVAADVANYATGGAVVIHYTVQHGTG
jgi:hypothetical protein